MAYIYKSGGTNWYLHMREAKMKNSDRKIKLYFFSKRIQKGAIDELPSDRKVIVNQRTGLPLLKKKK